MKEEAKKRMRVLLPQYPNEKKDIKQNLLADIFGANERDVPPLRSLSSAKEGDVILLRGEHAVFLQGHPVLRQKQQDRAITVLKEIDGEAYVCSYYEKDLEKK